MRAERRGEPSDDSVEEGRRGRRGLVIAGVVAAALVLGAGTAFALGAFSGAGGGAATPPPSTNVQLQAGEVTTYGTGLDPTNIPDGLSDTVMGVIGDYVDEGIVPGLRTGTVKDAALTSAFGEAALAQLAGEDRGVVLDEGLPKAIGKLTITSTPVSLTLLNDNQDTTVLVTAALDLRIRVRSDKGPYEITRSGQLELAPDGAGGWRITGWDLDVARTGAGLPAGQQTPTTAPPTTAAEVSPQ